jgi:hypothetical protein
MKERLQQVVSSVQQAVDRVRTWFDPPLNADARPLEVREAILEQIEARVEPAGSGRRVFPFDRVSVTVVTTSREHRAGLEAALVGIDGALRARLGELKCDVPHGLEVGIDYARRPRADWAPEQWLGIEYARSASAGTQPQRPSLPSLRLTIVRGAASQPSYTFAERQILVGRTATPIDQRGSPRQNHVVFLEDRDDESRTVGRAHASIQYHADVHEYRLFDDGSHNGTRLVRNGTVIEVLPRDPVGVALRSGDEIRFGTAVVEVVIEAPPG